MSCEQVPSGTIPDSLLDTIWTMHHTLHTMLDIDSRLSNAMEGSDLDPRLHYDLQCVRYATTAVLMSLSLMKITVKEVIKEIANSESHKSNPIRGAKRDREYEPKGNSRLAVAEKVIGKRYPLCSEVEIHNRASYLTCRINMKTLS